MGDGPLNDGPWVKVDKDAFRRGLDILSAADMSTPAKRREAFKRANAEIGIPPKRP